MSEAPDIDLTELDYPSDDLSIKAIRKRWPEVIDLRDYTTFEGHIPSPLKHPKGEYLYCILKMERDLAVAVYNDNLGKEPPDLVYADNDIKNVIEDLKQYYIDFGIASGPHHADQLIRRLETQALAQASQHVPPRP